MERLLDMLWTSPLYTHTIQGNSNENRDFQKNTVDSYNAKFQNKSLDSIFLRYITHFEKKNEFVFKDSEVFTEIEKIKDNMGAMWSCFKEGHFTFALDKLNTLSTLSLDNKEYFRVINENVNNLIPIFSIYEIFNRSLSETVYPESIPQTKRIGSYTASFLSSRFNPLGVNLMNLFNRLAFNNWSYYIVKNNLTRTQLFNNIFKLPIWKYIPEKITKKILESKD
jgi:hypothetical protein